MQWTLISEVLVLRLRSKEDKIHRETGSFDFIANVYQLYTAQTEQEVTKYLQWDSMSYTYEQTDKQINNKQYSQRKANLKRNVYK